jgi:cystathionine beta-lyase
VWGKETLSRLVGICAERGVVLISDEIHQDIVMEGFRHIPITSLPGADRIAMMLFAPTKTFNIAGLSGSFALIPDEGLRRKFAVEKLNTDFPFPNPLSLAGQEAAYRHGDGWLEALLGYLKGNYESFVEVFTRRLPAVKVFPLEGTYLAWLDMRGLGLSDKELKERLIQKAGVWLDEGVKFGRGGEGFQRINLACPRRILMLAIDRIAAALS